MKFDSKSLNTLNDFLSKNFIKTSLKNRICCKFHLKGKFINHIGYNDVFKFVLEFETEDIGKLSYITKLAFSSICLGTESIIDDYNYSFEI